MMFDTTKRLRPTRLARLIGAMAIMLGGCGDGGSAEGPPGGPGPAGPDGPEGPAAEPDEPSITGVSPAWVWLSRSQAITIGGYNTDWDDATSVDFGAGITVDDVVVASPTSLVATISVTDGAAVGRRDVVVTSGGDSLTHAGAFDVRPGADVTIIAGDGTQGSFNVFLIDLHDAAHSLTGGQYDDPTGTPFSTVMEGAGEEVLPVQDIGLTLYDEHFAIVPGFLDVTAPATAPLSLVTNSGFSEELVSTGVLYVAPSTPEDLILATPAEVDYGSVPYATKLLRYTNDTGADSLVFLAVGDGAGGEPMAFRYARHSGRIADGYAVTVPSGTILPTPVRDGEDVYMMTFAPDGDTDFTFMGGAVTAVPAEFYASDEVDDDACEDAQNTSINLAVDDFMAIDGGVLRTGLNILELADEPLDADWYRFSVLSEDVTISCQAHSNHDLVGVQIYSVGDCDTPAVAPLGSGDYYLSVLAARQVSTHGAGHYAVMCQLSAAP
jgi:hypothetical protein